MKAAWILAGACHTTAAAQEIKIYPGLVIKKRSISVKNSWGARDLALGLPVGRPLAPPPPWRTEEKATERSFYPPSCWFRGYASGPFEGTRERRLNGKGRGTRLHKRIWVYTIHAKFVRTAVVVTQISNSRAEKKRKKK